MAYWLGITYDWSKYTRYGYCCTLPWNHTSTCRSFLGESRFSIIMFQESTFSKSIFFIFRIFWRRKELCSAMSLELNSMLLILLVGLRRMDYLSSKTKLKAFMMYNSLATLQSILQPIVLAQLKQIQVLADQFL